MSTDIPTDFASLKLGPELLQNLDSLGYAAMTPIQAQSLPFILDGKDVIGQAMTGSGKTAAFGLGLLEALERKQFKVQAVVLCPTRELADQVANAIRELARTLPNVKVLTLCGGTPFGPQAKSLEQGTHIVVGTPGRIDDHLRKQTLKLGAVRTLVLDEADRMLEMGFQDEIDAVVAAVPVKRQTLLFSATYQDDTRAIAERIMRAPEHVTAEAVHDSASIEQHFFQTDDDAARLNALRLLLIQHQPESTLVFCNTKREAQALAETLREHQFSVLALHGDLEQNDRDRTLLRFANKSIAVLVATDVAARGLDIDSLDAVVNYHLAHDTEIHTHRIGRTGRAGSAGAAFTFFADKERYKIERLEEALSIVVTPETLPRKSLLEKRPPLPSMETLSISGGKKQKLRPGDILGALTGEQGIAGTQVGKINVFDNVAYVAVSRDAAKAALNKLREGKLKGRFFKVSKLTGQPTNSRRLASRHAARSNPTASDDSPWPKPSGGRGGRRN